MVALDFYRIVGYESKNAPFKLNGAFFDSQAGLKAIRNAILKFP
jgi:hypothetical protein